MHTIKLSTILHCGAACGMVCVVDACEAYGESLVRSLRVQQARGHYAIHVGISEIM